MKMTLRLFVALLGLVASIGAAEKVGVNWPSFRGRDAAGVADGSNLPETWDGAAGTGIKWKTPIPGLAHSSPVVWATACL